MNKELKELTVKAAYCLTDIVYLRVADNCKAGMITSIQLNADGGIFYGVTWHDKHSWHYAAELSNQYVPDFCKEFKS